MATASDVKSISGTLTTTAEDIVNLTQFWDRIEIDNKSSDQGLYVKLDGGTAVAAGAGTEYIGPTQSKVFDSGIVNELGVPGSTTQATVCHKVSLIGSANAYTVTGLARTF